MIVVLICPGSLGRFHLVPRPTITDESGDQSLSADTEGIGPKSTINEHSDINSNDAEDVSRECHRRNRIHGTRVA